MQSYRLTRKQNEYIKHAFARWNLKIGAVRSGKSFVDIAHVIPRSLVTLADKPGLNVILGVSKETIERNVLQPMREIYTDAIVGFINSRNIATVCGVPVYCLGAEKGNQVAKVQGMSIKYCYGDEIAKWNREVFAMLQSRLDKPYSRFDGACNPEAPGHWLKAFIDRDDINAYVQHYTIFDNPYLPRQFVEDLCAEYAGTVYYGRYIDGEWTLAEGLIYPMYNSAIEEQPKDNPEGYVLSVDYGTRNAFAAILWEKHGAVWYGCKEFYHSGRDTGVQLTDEEYAMRLDAWLEDVPRPLRCVIDPSAASFITLLRKHGGYKVMPADNSVEDGIRNTATSMQRGLIKINPGLESWKREIQGYVWDDKSGIDKPVKDNDHAMDAMRYFVQTLRVYEVKKEYKPVIFGGGRW